MEVQDLDKNITGPTMLPPPVGIFQTREDLLKHVRDFALSQGYMISIKDSSKDRYVTIGCDKGGVYRKRLKSGENMRQRKMPTRLTNCPFEVVGKKDDELWTLTIKHGEHNHEPSTHVSDHPSCRRFTEEEILIIREMSAAGKRPRQILKVLRQRNPDLISDSRNVYNVKAKIRRESLSGEKLTKLLYFNFPIPTSVSVSVSYSGCVWHAPLCRFASSTCQQVGFGVSLVVYLFSCENHLPNLHFTNQHFLLHGNGQRKGSF